MSKPAAIYARVSSDRQKENHTIDSQVAALIEYADRHGYMVPPEWRFQDEGCSGATLVRPGLEALRDLSAQGHIETVLIYSPEAKSGLPGASLLRQNRDPASTTHHSTAAPTPRGDKPRQCQPRTASLGLDRNRRAPFGG